MFIQLSSLLFIIFLRLFFNKKVLTNSASQTRTGFNTLFIYTKTVVSIKQIFHQIADVMHNFLVLSAIKSITFNKPLTGYDCTEGASVSFNRSCQTTSTTTNRLHVGCQLYDVIG
jgi:hypothetical protein